MTNYEWVKSLSINDLTSFLFTDKCSHCAYKYKICRNEKNCYDGLKEWLNEEHVPKLKPCPVCKSEMEVKCSDGYYLICSDCELYFGVDTGKASEGVFEGDYRRKNELIETWNSLVGNTDESKHEEEIKLCSCGEKPFVNQDSVHYWVSCSCGARGPYGTTREEVIEAWNRGLKEGKDNDY